MMTKHFKYLIRIAFGVMFSSIIMNGIARADSTDPSEVLREGVEEVIEGISQRRGEFTADKSVYYAFIHDQIVTHIDINLFSRAVLGKYSRGATSEQLKNFQIAFEDFLIGSYADALLEYDGEKVEFSSAKVSERGSRLIADVPSNITSSEGTFKIIYKMIDKKKDGDWKIYDVVFEDLSLGINFRNSYSDIIESKGLDYLIELLREKSAGA